MYAPTLIHTHTHTHTHIHSHTSIGDNLPTKCTAPVTAQMGPEGALTDVFPIHVVEEAEAVGWGVVDAVGVLGSDGEERTHQPGLIALLARTDRKSVV